MRARIRSSADWSRNFATRVIGGADWASSRIPKLEATRTCSPARLVFQELGLCNCRTGRFMKKARSGGQSWKV